MNPEWATAIVAIIGMLATGASVIWRAGQHDAKIAAAIERLTSIAEDHEKRIRKTEKGQRR